MATELPLIVIVGPTASGKSSLALDLAERYNGEIICADSRSIYKGMDIGTAKPSADDQARVPHWGIDLVEPNESFSASDFKDYAVQKIAEIRERGHTPFLVGGTGLYIDGIIFDYQFTPADPAQRLLLEKMTLAELYKYCDENNVSLPENDKNKRYVIRAIERNSISGKMLAKPINNCIVVGIATNKESLQQRIHERSEQLFLNGVVKEASMLGEKYGWDSEAMTGNIYRLVHEYLQDQLTLDELKERFEISDWQLAKRQLTWLKRNPFIQWLELDEAEKYLAHTLTNFVQA